MDATRRIRRSSRSAVAASARSTVRESARLLTGRCTSTRARPRNSPFTRFFWCLLMIMSFFRIMNCYTLLFWIMSRFTLSFSVMNRYTLPFNTMITIHFSSMNHYTLLLGEGDCSLYGDPIEDYASVAQKSRRTPHE